MLKNELIRHLKYCNRGLIILEIERDEFDTPVDMLIKKVNPAFESMFKLSSRDLTGKNAAFDVPPFIQGRFRLE